MEAWGRGGKVAGSEAGSGSRARLTPVADPFMLRRAKTEKKVNYPKRGPPHRFPPSLLLPELFPLSLKPLAAAV